MNCATAAGVIATDAIAADTLHKNPTTFSHSIVATSWLTMLFCVVAGGCANTDRGDAPRVHNANGSVALAGSPITGAQSNHAGIAQITFDSSAFDQTAQWTIETTPVTVAGGVDTDAEYDLSDVWNAVLFSDGAVVAMGRSAKILVFAADGKPERTIGRMGEGPREFRSGGNLFLLPGDTMLIVDRGNNRVNWVTRRSDFAHMKPMSKTSVHFPVTAGVFPGGEIVLRDLGTEDGDNGMATATVVAVANAGAARELVRLPESQNVAVETRYRGQQRQEQYPARYATRAAVIVWGNHIATGNGAGYHIDIRNDSPRIVQQIHANLPRRPVTQHMRDSAIAVELARMSGSRGETGGMVDVSESRRLAREIPFADSLPSFQQFFVTPNGTLWVLEPTVWGDTSWTATAFNASGAMIGRLRAPGSARVMNFANDRVLLRVSDADDVVSLRVHRIVLARPH